MSDEKNIGIERMYAPSELARLLGCTQATLSWWRKAGTGPRFTRMGFSGRTSKVRYMESDVREWQASLPKSDVDTQQRAMEEAERVA